jgi:hypothetical protein
MFALPGANQSALQRVVDGSPQSPTMTGLREQRAQEMPVEKMVRLVIWVQASFRGVKARADVRRMLQVEKAKKQPDDTVPAYVKPPSGMAAAKAKTKAKQRAKAEAKRIQEEKQKGREDREAERVLQNSIRRKFVQLDVDGSGTLDEDELGSLLSEMGVKLSRGQMQKAMAKMDGDNSGEVEFDEFAQWWREYQNPDKQKSFFSFFEDPSPDELAAQEYKAKVSKAAKEVAQHAKKKRKGRLGKLEDGLWPHHWLWAVYFVTGFFILFCGLYTVMIALSFGPETTFAWLGGFITTLVYQSVIQDPCKIGLVILFMDSAEFWLELYYEFMEFLPFDISFMMEEE